MFKMTIEAVTVEELNGLMAELAARFGVEATAPAPKATPRKAKATPAPAPEPEAAPADDEDLGFDPNEVGEPMPATAMAVVDAGTGKPVEAAPVQMTLDDVKVAAAKLASTDTPALVAILKKYGAPNLSGVPKDQLADFAADVMEALG